MRSARMGMMLLGSRPSGLLCSAALSSSSPSSSGRQVSTAVGIWTRKSSRRTDEIRRSWASVFSNDWRGSRCGDADVDKRGLAVRASNGGEDAETAPAPPLPASSAPDRREVYHLEFDGACKGNPGRAGAGALLRRPDGSVECEVMESLGTATNNQAEYRGLIVGLRAAQERGVSRLVVQGDSNLVCRQVLGEWTVNSPNLMSLCNEARQLVREFEEFSIHHVDRKRNAAADKLANKAIQLQENQRANQQWSSHHLASEVQTKA